MLKSIKVSTAINPRITCNDHEHQAEDLFTPSMMIVASKWSQSLEILLIESRSMDRYAISNCLMLLTDLHEIHSFYPFGWRMENMDDEVRCLVMSWPKLRTLRLPPLNPASISLSTLRIIAENCPELRYLHIPLDISTIPPFNTSNKNLRHNLEVLSVWRVHPSTQLETVKTTSECGIQVARYLNFIFPYLKSIEVDPENVTWSGIRDMVKLCQVITPEELSTRQRK